MTEYKSALNVIVPSRHIYRAFATHIQIGRAARRWTPTRRATKYVSQFEKLNVSAPPRASWPLMYFACSLLVQCVTEVS